jgi:hypothetical protein
VEWEVVWSGICYLILAAALIGGVIIYRSIDAGMSWYLRKKFPGEDPKYHKFRGHWLHQFIRHNDELRRVHSRIQWLGGFVLVPFWLLLTGSFLFIYTACLKCAG